MNDSPDRRALLKDALVRIESLQARLEKAERASREPIAVIGLALRFPGNANDCDGFWRNLHDGLDAIREVPPERWKIEDYYDPNVEAAGKIYSRHGGFLDAVDRFDADFFGIAPREAVSMDPQHRLLLEVTWEALENSAVAPQGLVDTRTGVFVGITANDYLQLVYGAGAARADAYRLTGNALNFAAGRIAYTLGLQGPTMAVDTACSSSLVAVHVACQSLRLGECNLALAAGVNLILSPEMSINLCKARMLAPDGRCKTFDEAANGFVRADGCAVIVLKRFSEALAEGNNILALIRGSAVNQDGQSSGLTVPNKMAQEAVIQQALENAGLEPNRVSYVEAHGTGTPLGDPIEVRALLSVYGWERAASRPLVIGSLKTNIGHMEAAAGIGGLIKTVLALNKREIPPHIHFQKLNPGIPFSGSMIIPNKPLPWSTADEPRFASVSSFGASGTNAHVILEEAPLREPPEDQRPFELLCVSAKSAVALMQLAQRYETHVLNGPAASLADICFTANAGRSHFAHRLAVVAPSTRQLGEKLTAYINVREFPEVVSGEKIANRPPKVALLFTGQGSQYIGMGRQLYETSSVFRAALDRCAELFGLYSDRPLLSLLYPEETQDSTLDETGYTQPALFALEYALAELWRSWGIQPFAVLGHSVGEYVAACVAGVFSLEDGMRLIAERARLMQALPRNGAMAAIFTGESDVARLVAPRAHEVSIAAVNGPQNVVISGARDAVQDVMETLSSRGINGTYLKVSHAFHSPLMEPILDSFERVAAGISYSSPQMRLVSNVTGETVSGGSEMQAAYWRRHVREPVRFFAGMRALETSGCEVFLEVGPQPTLVGLGKHCLPAKRASWLSSLRQGREDWQQILDTLASLYVCGADVEWQEFYRDRHCRPVPLPTYPFQRQRFWVEASSSSRALANLKSGGVHPFVRHCAVSPAVKDVIVDMNLGTSDLAYLDDHCVHGLKVVPLAAQIEMIMAASRSAWPGSSYVLQDLELRKPLLFAEEKCAVQIVLTRDNDDGASFQVISIRTAESPSWKTHTCGRLAQASRDMSSDQREDIIERARLRCGNEIAATEYYRKLSHNGLAFGPSFRGIEKLWNAEGESIAEIRVPTHLESQLDEYEFHPALLDACLQAVSAAQPGFTDKAPDSQTYLPFSVERVSLFRRPTTQLWSHVVVRPAHTQRDETHTADITIYDRNLIRVAQLRGFVLKRTTADTWSNFTSDDIADWFYEITWQPDPLTSFRPARSPAETFLIFADSKGVGVRLADRIAESGQSCVLVHRGTTYAALNDHFQVNPERPEDFAALLRDAYKENASCVSVVHLWNVDSHSSSNSDLDALHRAHAAGTGSLLHLTQALVKAALPIPPRLWVVTEGAREVSSAALISLGQAPSNGLAKVISREHPELRCTTVDLDGTEDDAVRHLHDEIIAGSGDDEVAFRGALRYVPRLSRHACLSKVSLQSEPDEKSQEYGDRLQLKISQPGSLDALTLATVPRRALRHGEVEIAVRAAGLNFRDILNALGMYPGDAGALGWECAGTVMGVGSGVEEFSVGDQVIAVAPGAMGNSVTTISELVVPKPSNVGFNEAATIPSAFLTAHYTLIHLARLSAGEKLLIHSAAGGVGLAAVQLAQRAGAEIYATAGSPEKHEFLKGLGVPHVFQSRSLDFAEQILQLTKGRGVDIVLNSLSGEFIPKSLFVLNENGRFLEIGKRDIWDDARVAQFKKIGAYHVVDLGRTARENPRLLGSMLRELVEALKDGKLKPLPLRAFAMTHVVSAFRHMQQAKHIGKIVIIPEKPADQGALRGSQRGHEKTTLRTKLRENGTYLISGGLGGLGLSTARWMVQSGAESIVLMGRHTPSADAAKILSSLNGNGVRITVVNGNVANESDVARVLSHIKKFLPPLRGIIHAAAVLNDGAIVQQSWPRFTEVFAPKIDGAWHLHHLTQHIPLDFFVVYSSMASLLGSRGQSNYTAANAFLDALCVYRRAIGLPATSIQWGPWSGVGVAAGRSVGDRLAAQGIRSMTPERGLQALEAILAEGVRDIAVLPIDWFQYGREFRESGKPSLLSSVFQSSLDPKQNSRAVQGPDIVASLAQASSSQRRKLLCDFVVAQSSRVLGLASPQAIKLDQPLHELGMDSLMAVELRNLLCTGLDLKARLPATLLFDYPTVDSVVEHLLRDVLKPEASVDSAGDRTGQPRVDNPLSSDLEQLSNEDAELLLAKELESLERLADG